MADTVTLEDGVLVTHTPITLANGSAATRFSVPIVTADRVDTVDPASSAQININGNLQSLGTGWGLTAVTRDPYRLADAKGAVDAALATLPGTISASEAAYFGRYTEQYLSTQDASTPITVSTYSPIVGSMTPTERIGLGDLGVSVIDLSQTQSKGTVAVFSSFAAVTGEGTVFMVSNGAIAVGDDASQHFIAPTRGGSVYAGGGNDTFEFPFGFARIDGVFHGGSGYDTVVTSGTFEQRAGYVMVKGSHGVNLKLVNVERIIENFSGRQIDITATTSQKAVATLYMNILGRQPDLNGFEYWDNQIKAGQTLGQVAITMTRSTESGNVLFNGNTSHDLDTLYNVILKRPTDPVGKAYWSAQIDQGLQTLEQVAQGFVISDELTAAYMPQTEWNFFI